MKSDTLKTCIGSLRDLRTQQHTELEAGVAKELDDVILQLESCWEEGGHEVEVPASLGMRTLKVMLECLTLVTNLAELIDYFFGPK